MNHHGKISHSEAFMPMQNNLDSHAIITQEEQTMPRCAVMLVLDTSHSMWGEGLRDMMDSLRAFYSKLNQIQGLRSKTDIAAVSMGENLCMLENFTQLEHSRLPGMNIRPKGDTPVGAALKLALSKLRDQKALYEQNGWPYLPSKLIILSDGHSTDNVADVARDIQALTSSGQLSCHVVVTGSSPNLDVLSSIAGENIRMPIRGGMKEAFKEIGQKVCRSLEEKTQASRKPREWAASRCDSSSLDGGSPAYVLDGTNIIHWAQNRKGITLKYLLAMTKRFQEEGTSYRVFFDASTQHLLPASEQGLYKRLTSKYRDTFLQVPSGTKADDFILQMANTHPNCRVISQDHFREYSNKYPWISQHNRVIQGMIAGDTLLIPELNFIVSA